MSGAYVVCDQTNYNTPYVKYATIYCNMQDHSNHDQHIWTAKQATDMLGGNSLLPCHPATK